MVACRHMMTHLLLADEENGLQMWRFEVIRLI
jgi:hypothetical protein